MCYNTWPLSFMFKKAWIGVPRSLYEWAVGCVPFHPSSMMVKPLSMWQRFYSTAPRDVHRQGEPSTSCCPWHRKYDAEPWSNITPPCRIIWDIHEYPWLDSWFVHGFPTYTNTTAHVHARGQSSLESPTWASILQVGTRTCTSGLAVTCCRSVSKTSALEPTNFGGLNSNQFCDSNKLHMTHYVNVS